MSTYARDLLTRLVATAIATGVGVLVVELGDRTVWWALPIAALLTALRSLAAGVDSFASLTASLTERTGWTLAQVALAAVPTALWGVPAEYVPLIAAGLMLLKGLVARRIGSPDSAATLTGRFALAA